MSRPLPPTVNDFIDHLANDEALLAAITHSVHRFYHDKCFSSYSERPFNNEIVKLVNELHNILWLQSPGWRDTLQLTIKRYQVEDAEVKWLPIDSKQITNEPTCFFGRDECCY